jgi:MFS family permease
MVILRLVRQTFILVSAIGCFEATFFTVLAPLLPHYTEHFHLSVTDAGLLTATYAAGALAAAVPSGLLVSRIGVKATALSGLALLSAASVLFGLAPDAALIFVARTAQGCGCALAWTGGLAWLVAQAPAERRGEVIGAAVSAAIAGCLLGPGVGAIASVVGLGTTFVALAAAGLALTVWGATIAGGAPQTVSLATFRQAFSRRALVHPAVNMALAGLLLGVISALAPLRLAGLGWSAAAIAAVFLLTAVLQIAVNPLVGRWSDRRGSAAPLRFGLVASAVASLTLATSAGRWGYAVLVIAAGVAFGLLWTPGMTQLTEGAAELGLGFAAGSAVMNLAWSPGQLVGAAGGGILAQAAGGSVPYLVTSGLCVAGLGAFAPRWRVRPSRRATTGGS